MVVVARPTRPAMSKTSENGSIIRSKAYRTGKKDRALEEICARRVPLALPGYALKELLRLRESLTGLRYVEALEAIIRATVRWKERNWKSKMRRAYRVASPTHLHCSVTSLTSY
jgi:hypothetical protein